jgi:hypothetical protein
MANSRNAGAESMERNINGQDVRERSLTASFFTLAGRQGFQSDGRGSRGANGASAASVRQSGGNPMHAVIMAVAVCGILAGCTGSTAELQSLSAGRTGCPASDITISNSRVGIKTASWTASCQGKTYFCSGDDMLRGVSCALQQ